LDFGTLSAILKVGGLPCNLGKGLFCKNFWTKGLKKNFEGLKKKTFLKKKKKEFKKRFKGKI
jgi:hypothetical protein